MEYFVVLNLEGQLIGVASSLDILRLSKITRSFLHCDLDNAQYIRVNNKFYHGVDFLPQDKKFIVPDVLVRSITKQEYLNTINA